jgi:hypothetical protein
LLVDEIALMDVPSVVEVRIGKLSEFRKDWESWRPILERKEEDDESYVVAAMAE